MGIKRHKKSLLYLFRYRNLLLEVEKMGEKVSTKDALEKYGIMIFISFIACYLYKLSYKGYVAVLICAILVTPSIILNGYRSAYMKRRFNDVQKYILKMLDSYKKSGKIYTSLRSIVDAFEPGEMKTAILKAIDIIENDPEANVEVKALDVISREFENERVRILHKYLLSVEFNGGDYTLGIDMLSDDSQKWILRVKELQQRRAALKGTIIGSIVFTLGLCLILLYVPEFIPAIKEYVDISENAFVQISAVLFIISLLVYYRAVSKKLADSWMDEHKALSVEKEEKRYQMIIDYDAKKERTKSLIYAAVSMAITSVVFILFRQNYLVVLGIVISAFLLNSHKLSCNILKKQLERDIKMQFPSWLLNVALKLQYENVQMAIAKSYEEAPGVIRPAIREMLLKLDDDPESQKPFNEFMKGIDVEEIKEAVSTLYDISQTSRDQSDSQFKDLIKRNNEMIDRSEKLKNEDKITLLNGLIIVPELFGSAKLIVDLCILLLSFFGMTNSMI